MEGWELKNRIGIMKQRKLWSIPCRALDRIILERLFDLVEHDSDMVERIKRFGKAGKLRKSMKAHVLQGRRSKRHKIR